MKSTVLMSVAAFAATMALTTGASAQLTDHGAFGQTTYSSGGTYTPGRNMKWASGATFQAYCIDPFTGTSFPGTYSQISLDAFTSGAGSGYAEQVSRGGGYTGLSTSNAVQLQVRNDIKELFGWAYQDAATTGNTAKAAAFGLVLWEIVMQNFGALPSASSYSRTAGFTTTGGDTTSGNFGATVASSTDKVEFWTEQYLRALNGTTAWTTVLGVGATLKSWNYTVYYDGLSPLFQTFIRVTPGTVSAPATLALVGIGLVGLAALRRKASAR